MSELWDKVNTAKWDLVARLRTVDPDAGALLSNAAVIEGSVSGHVSVVTIAFTRDATGKAINLPGLDFSAQALGEMESAQIVAKLMDWVQGAMTL